MNTVIDRVVEFPHRYKLTDITTGVVLGIFDFEAVTGLVQVTGTPINKALFDSIAADIARIDTAIPSKYYKSFAEISDTITTSSGILDVIKLMNDNSILVTQVSDGDSTHYDNIVPSTSYRLGVLEIIKYNNNRTACRYTAMSGTTQGNPCAMWFGETQTDTSQTPSVLVWSGWNFAAKFSSSVSTGTFAFYSSNGIFGDSGLSKTTSISASSSDLQIPTAKAVYDCVAGNSSAETFTFIVDSDSALTAWANATAGNDYTSVLIKNSAGYTAGANSGKYTCSAQINTYAAGTKRVVGETGAVVYFSGTTNSTSGFYDTRSVGYGIACSFENLIIETNYLGFYYCCNVSNSYVNVVNSSGGRGYEHTYNIINCTATGYCKECYYYCSFLSNCVAISSYSSTKYAYRHCDHIVNCDFNATFTKVYQLCTSITRGIDSQTYSIAANAWTAYAGDLYQYQTTLSNTAPDGFEIMTDSEVWLDADVETISEYGLVIKSITDSSIVLLATDEPDSAISVNIIIK